MKKEELRMKKWFHAALRLSSQPFDIPHSGLAARREAVGFLT
jgi:hypothetical protein